MLVEADSAIVLSGIQGEEGALKLDDPVCRILDLSSSSECCVL